MRLNELRDISYEIAQSKGWHDPEFDTATFADRMALTISELSEALEEHRKSKPARHIEFAKAGEVITTYLGGPVPTKDQTPGTLIESGCKPEGVVIELADALIRIGDCAGKHALDLEHECPEDPELDLSTVARLVCPPTCPPLTPSFGSWLCQVSHALALAAMTAEGDAIRRPLLLSATKELGYMVHWLGIPPEEFVRAIEIKQAYNRTRPFRHGGKTL